MSDTEQVKGLPGLGSQQFKGSSASSGHRETNQIRAFLHPFWKQHGRLGLLLVAVTVIAYLPALSGQFVWDDDDYVTNNSSLHSLGGLLRIWFVPGATRQYYPLSFTSFWLDYHLWGLNPVGYHLTNVLLQSLNAVLLWRVLRGLEVRGAWLAAALFALHPVNVESVAWVTERKNLLAGFFYLGSVLACLRFWLPQLPAGRDGNGSPHSAVGLGRWKFYWLGLGLYLCALLAKTAAIALPVVVGLVVWWQRGRMRWRAFFPLGPFVGLGLGMGLLTVWVERHFVHAVGKEWTFSFLERSLIGGRAVWFYLGKLIWPHPLMFVYPRWGMEPAPVAAYVPVLALALGLWLLWWQRGRWARPVLVALVYFLALLFPVLGFFNVYYFRYSFVADHFQYLASIGPLTLAGAVFGRGMGVFKRWGWVLGGGLLGLLGVLTWRQCGMYANLETLWRTTIARNPDCWMAKSNLGTLLSDRGKPAEAETLFREALRVAPDYPEAHYNLGVALARQGKLPEAIQHYVWALQLNPNYADAFNNLGGALAKQKKLAEAIQCYERALQLKPDYADAYYNLGNALANQGRLNEAIQRYERALRLEPDFAEVHCNWGNALANQGKLAEAVRHYERALQLKPDDAEAHCSLGNTLAAQGRLVEAIQCYERAIQLKPDDAEAHCSLGAVLATQGKLAEAVQHFEQALRLKPDYAEAACNLGIALASQGKSAEAVLHFQQALALATAQGKAMLAESIRTRLRPSQPALRPPPTP